MADFSETSATSGLKLEKEYVRANGQVVAINSTCGPRPLLALSTPATVGSDVWFDKADYVTATGSYTISIKTDDGRARSIVKPLPLDNHFSLSQSDLYPVVTNHITLETTAACGRTGYSNAVAYAYTPDPGGACVNSMSSHRSSFTSIGSSLKAAAVGTCAAGTKYNVYFLAAGDDAIYPLNGSSPTSNPWKILSNIPCGSGEGQYWVAPVDPVTHFEVGQSPIVQVDATCCAGSADHISSGLAWAPGQPSMNAQYVAWDHLGSTRLVTDEQGVVVASSKFYPFGYEAESTGGAVRQKFTGHERDERVGLDYMMARDSRMALGRFLEPDPYDGSARLELPQSWNRYAYVLNDPINAIDPNGYEELKEKSDHSDPAQTGSNGPVENAGSQSDNAPGAGMEGAGIYAGTAAVNDAIARVQYVVAGSNVASGDTNARTALKTATRAASSAVGAAVSEAISPIANEAAKAGGTANRTNSGVTVVAGAAGVVGTGLLLVSAGTSINNVANAPAGGKLQAATKEGWKWAGALAGGEAGGIYGAGVGTGLAGPPGGAVGALVGALIGSVAGGILGSRAGD